MDKVTIIGRDKVGIVASYEGEFRYYLTECCHASAKGGERGIICRACYRDIPIELGGCPPDGDLPIMYGSGITPGELIVVTGRSRR